MARYFEPTPEQEALWKAWVAERPGPARKIAKQFDPWTLYLLKSTGNRVTLHSLSEGDGDGKVAVTVNVLGKYNIVAFERQVFGIDPADLEPCELPSPGEPVGGRADRGADSDRALRIDQLEKKSLLVRELAHGSPGLNSCWHSTWVAITLAQEQTPILRIIRSCSADLSPAAPRRGARPQPCRPRSRTRTRAPAARRRARSACPCSSDLLQRGLPRVVELGHRISAAATVRVPITRQAFEVGLDLDSRGAGAELQDVAPVFAVGRRQRLEAGEGGAHQSQRAATQLRPPGLHNVMDRLQVGRRRIVAIDRNADRQPIPGDQTATPGSEGRLPERPVSGFMSILLDSTGSSILRLLSLAKASRLLRALANAVSKSVRKLPPVRPAFVRGKPAGHCSG
jgi:hypothetical protein